MMDGKMKLWLILGATFAVLGIAMMGIALMTVGLDFSKFTTTAYVTNTYEITDGFRDLDILVGAADVALVPSEDGICKVVCHEEEKLYHSVEVRDGVLCIQRVDERAWYDHIGIHIGNTRVTVYLPQAEYGKLTVDGSTGRADIPEDFLFESIDVTVSTGNVHNGASASDRIRIRTDTGSIKAWDITAASMELTVSTGRIDAESVTCDAELEVHVSTGDTYLTAIRCGTLLTDGSTGDLRLTDVVAGEKLDIRRTTGDVYLDACDAPVIVIETDTGHVTGSILTGKIFEAHTSTGKIQVPKSTAGGECKITTSTGDIRIGVE